MKQESEKNNLVPPMYSSITVKGKVKPLNEDQLYCHENISLIADGMGGHVGGDIASKTAIKVIVEEYQKQPDLVNAIKQAHLTMAQLNTGVDAKDKMGTTVVASISAADSYKIAWVGDSRAYLWDLQTQQLQQLSKDHSLVNHLIDQQTITQKQALYHSKRHVITQSLGLSTTAALTVDTIKGRWQAKQQILLCSDGLSTYVSNGIISQILSLPISNQQKLTHLVEAVNQKGGQDDVSIILLDSPIGREY
ncbi:MAG: protein phosphatase 2C domain-containing protein [Colwellia sp.]|nr:protein phosphatase 2C domain-containing protein [Colwellia sp.]